MKGLWLTPTPAAGDGVEGASGPEDWGWGSSRDQRQNLSFGSRCMQLDVLELLPCESSRGTKSKNSP